MATASDAQGAGARYGAVERPVFSAQASTSGQFQAGLPPTVQDGSGSTSRSRHMSTVCRLTPRRSAISGMPTGSQIATLITVEKDLTSVQWRRDNHYMSKIARRPTGARSIKLAHPVPWNTQPLPGASCSRCHGSRAATTTVVVGCWVLDTCEPCSVRLVDLLQMGCEA